jgi:hypothetical protein
LAAPPPPPTPPMLPPPPAPPVLPPAAAAPPLPPPPPSVVVVAAAVTMVGSGVGTVAVGRCIARGLGWGQRGARARSAAADSSQLSWTYLVGDDAADDATAEAGPRRFSGLGSDLNRRWVVSTACPHMPHVPREMGVGAGMVVCGGKWVAVVAVREGAVMVPGFEDAHSAISTSTGAVDGRAAGPTRFTEAGVDARREFAAFGCGATRVAGRTTNDSWDCLRRLAGGPPPPSPSLLLPPVSFSLPAIMRKWKKATVETKRRLFLVESTPGS